MINWLDHYWPLLTGILAAGAAMAACGHALLFKRDVRAAAGWVGLILFVPIVGAFLYVLLGINRIERKALALRSQRQRFQAPLGPSTVSPEALEQQFGPADAEHARLVTKVAGRSLLPGNQIVALEDGDEAFPAMREAISSARCSVALATYIFDNDSEGLRFINALTAARERGVDVRVLIDAAGVRYTRPPIHHELQRRGISVALFMPIVFARLFHLNLRNHRKILTVDGQVGFTGGINIRRGHVLKERPPKPVRDLHFQLRGPVVGQLQEVFAEDWEFSTGEVLSGPAWFPSLKIVGETPARGISDGPDEDLDRLHWTILGAIATAKRSIRIVTPYFLPETAIISALNVAALRGVDVDVVLPAEINVRPVQWAMWAQLWRVLKYGVKVWLTPPPFDHTKLMVVDSHWVLFGSSNWDPRSLRLNFEFNVEAYDNALGEKLGQAIDARIAQSKRLSQADLDARPLPVRLRDGIARLFSPYL